MWAAAATACGRSGRGRVARPEAVSKIETPEREKSTARTSWRVAPSRRREARTPRGGAAAWRRWRGRGAGAAPWARGGFGSRRSGQRQHCCAAHGEAAPPRTGRGRASDRQPGCGGSAAPSGNSDTRITPTAGDRQQRGPSYGDLIGNKGGLTALLFAVRDGNKEAANALVLAGAKVNHTSEGDHTSPLLMATINGRFDLAKWLLERGADPKLASDAGATPLYTVINVVWAPKALYPQPVSQFQAQTGYLELMETLLKAGADVNARLTKHLWYMSYNFDLLSVSTAAPPSSGARHTARTSTR